MFFFAQADRVTFSRCYGQKLLRQISDKSHGESLCAGKRFFRDESDQREVLLEFSKKKKTIIFERERLYRSREKQGVPLSAEYERKSESSFMERGCRENRETSG